MNSRHAAHILAMALSVFCASSAKAATFDAADGRTLGRQPSIGVSGESREDPSPRVLAAEHGRLVAWFPGSTVDGGVDSWLAVVWSTSQCRPLFFMVVFDRWPGSPLEDGPLLADLDGDAGAWRSLQRAAWTERGSRGLPVARLDSGAAGETFERLRAPGSGTLTVQFAAFASAEPSGSASFSVSDFREIADYLEWRCVDPGNATVRRP